MMSVIVVTGSAGLIGAESVRFFAAEGFDLVGIDNDMRRVFFGNEASTAWNRQRLEIEVKDYQHIDGDIRDAALINSVFASYGNAIAAVIHTAAQPSHDWAARDPKADFTVNANGTLNLLEATRRHCPEASFVFTSTNKVYGDRPNELPLVEQELRWELSPEHPFAAHGINESMSVRACIACSGPPSSPPMSLFRNTATISVCAPLASAVAALPGRDTPARRSEP
jgi:CDP-paratose 2-epimerase